MAEVAQARAVGDRIMAMAKGKGKIFACGYVS
jgi:hypothetical protein